ncbi:hypothetical protein Tco_0418871 [Tanacetum coccineum]
MSDLYDVKISVRSSVKLLLEIKGLLSMKPNRERLFRDTVFGPWLDIQSHENDSHMMHYVFQHQVSVSNLRPDCPPIIFHIGDHCPKEMSQQVYVMLEFIKGLDDQDGTFFQDDEGKICPKMNRMSVDDGDGVLDSQSDDGDGVLDSQTKDVIEEAAMLPTMSSNSPQAGNAGVSKFFAEFDALKKEVLLIKRRIDDEFDELTKRFSKLETSETFKPNFSSHHNDSSNHIGGVSSEAKHASSSSAHPGNDEDVSNLDDNMEIDGQNAKDGYSNSQHHFHLLIKALGTKIGNPSIDSVVVVPPKVDDPMLLTIKPKDDFDEADVLDSYDDYYMSLFNDEEQPAKSSLHDLELQQEPDIGDVKDGILEQANADKGKTTVIQETVREERPSLGRGLGTLKFKKKKSERALRPNYVLRSAKIRKKKMAMPLKSPFGQQSDTTLVPTKRKTRLCHNLPVAIDNDPLETALAYRERMLYNQALPSYMLSLDHNLTYSPLVTVVNDSYLLRVGTCHGIWCFSYGIPSICYSLWNPSIKRSINILVLAFNSQPKSDKILLGFGVRPDTLDPTIISVSYPRGGHGSWYVFVFTLSSMDWKKVNNDSLPRESIRFKRSSQVVVGRLIFWAGHERNGLTVPMCLSSLGNSMILSGSTDETDCYLFCGWSVLVDVTSLTSFTLLFAIPTPNYVKLLGFTNDEISLLGFANSIQYKESLILLSYPDRELYHMFLA